MGFGSTEGGGTNEGFGGSDRGFGRERSNDSRSPGDNRPEDRMSKAGNGTWGTASKQAPSVSVERMREIRAKTKKHGWNPTPAPPDEFTGSWQEWSDQYNKANELGKYSGMSGTPMGFHEVRKMSQMKPVAAQAYAKTVAKYNHPVRSAFHSFLSNLIPGVRGELTYDSYGNLATEKRFNVPEFTAALLSPHFMGIGKTTPAGVVAKTALAAADMAGYRSRDLVDTQSMSDALDERSTTPERSSEYRTPARLIEKRPEDILYPYTLEVEDLPAAPGVSFGSTPVRRAPALSALNRRRAAYGRV